MASSHSTKPSDLIRRRSDEMRSRMEQKGWANTLTLIGGQEVSLGTGDELTISGKSYTILDSTLTDFASKPLVAVSTGLDTQSLVTFDPNDKSDNFLKEKATLLASDLTKKHKGTSNGSDQAGIYSVLDYTIQFVRGKDCFDLRDGDDQVEDVNRFEEKWTKSHKEAYKGTPVIPLEEFVRKRVGVCRQHALFTAFLLHDLVSKKLLPPGQVFANRDTVPDHGTGTTGHVWVIYKPIQPRPDSNDQYNFYSVDTLNETEAFNVGKNRKRLESEKPPGYGKAAIENCVSRYAKSDLEDICYTTITDEKVKKNFIHAILDANSGSCRKFLNHQYRLGGDEALFAIKKALKNHKKDETFDKKLDGNYKPVFQDLERVLETETLHNKGYSKIEDPDDKQQFVLGLLCKPESARQAILAKQEKLDLEQLLNSLRSESPDRGGLYKQFVEYEDAQKNIEEQIANIIKNQATSVHDKHYDKLDRYDRKLFIEGLIAQSPDERSQVLDKQNSADLKHLRRILEKQGSKAKTLLSDVNKKIVNLNKDLELVNLIEGIILSGGLKVLPDKFVPHFFSNAYHSKIEVGSNKEKIKVPDSAKQMHDELIKADLSSVNLATLQKIIPQLKSIAEKTLENKKDRDESVTTFLEILADNEPDEWHDKLSVLHKKLVPTPHHRKYSSDSEESSEYSTHMHMRKGSVSD